MDTNTRQESAESPPASAAGDPGIGEAKVPSGQSGGENPGAVLLKDKWQIDPSKELQNLKNGAVPAFRVQSTRTGEQNLVGYICGKALPTRTTNASAVMSLDNPVLAPLRDHGAIRWNDGQEFYAFIYQDVLGEKLTHDDRTAALGLNEDAAMRSFIEPMFSVISDLHNNDLFHGGIRPSNLYTGISGKSEYYMLGDCLTAPPSYNQPVICEPLERAMADPGGKGMGTIADDLYAFGVTLAILLRNKDPMAGKDDKGIIYAKIEQGSYATLLGAQRFSGSLMELLRGLLADDPHQRWTFEELSSWMDGRRVSPRQGSKRHKASRPIEFNGMKIYRAPVLAMEFQRNPSEAARAIEDGDVSQWVKRSLEDTQCLKRIEEAQHYALDTGRGSGYNEKLVSYVSIAIDPGGPLRYGNAALMPDGIGSSLMIAMARNKDMHIYQNILSAKIATFWLSVQSEGHVDVFGLLNKFENCRTYILYTKPGYGIERCLYYLNAEAPCMSEKLKNHYVLNGPDMLLALNECVGRGEITFRIYDRHIIAFLAAREKNIIEPYLQDINSESNANYVLGVMRSLAAMQNQMAGGQKLAGLGKWAFDNSDELSKRFRNRKKRRELRNNAAKHAENGDLTKFLKLYDNNDELKRDQIFFRQAYKEYGQLIEEQNDLEQKLYNRGETGRSAGREISAIVSGVLGMIIILGFVLISFGGESPF